jgi:hypothetical protein
MQQYHAFAMAAFRIDNAMVANLDYTALQPGSKTFQADQHGCQVCHDSSAASRMFEFQELPRPRNAAGQERRMLQKCEVDKRICGGGRLGNY